MFCLYEDNDALSADILDAARWSFYVVGISHLIEACKTGKTLSIERLRTIASAVRYAALKERTDDVLAGNRHPPISGVTPPPDFLKSSAEQASASRGSRPYLVAQRKARAHPVIVNARNHREAHLLARADATIASFGVQISAFELSKPQLEAALAEGAIDLRASASEQEQVEMSPAS